MLIKDYGDDMLHLGDGFTYKPGETRVYALQWKPPTWKADWEVKSAFNVCIPTAINGYYYACLKSGMTGHREPQWMNMMPSEIVLDGSAHWAPHPYDFQLKNSDAIKSSTWDGVQGETVDSFLIRGGISTECRLTSVPSNKKFAIIRNTVTIDRDPGQTVTLERYLQIPILRV